MRKNTFFLLLVLVFSVDMVFAKVRVHWIDADTELPPKITSFSKSELQKIAEVVATDFSREYQDFHNIDFLTCKKVFEVVFSRGNAPDSEVWFGARNGSDVLFLNTNFVNRMSITRLKLVLFHEFSHSYDTMVADDLEYSGKDKLAKNLRHASEDRGKEKTALYKLFLQRAEKGRLR